MSYLDKIRNLDINLVPVLHSIISNANIKIVSDELNMSQSAVRDSLKRLRLYFNDELIFKGNGGLRRSQLSKDLMPILDQIIVDINSFIHRKPFYPFKSSRDFVIAASDDVVLSIGPEIVREVEVLAPNVSLQFVDTRWAFSKRLEIGEIDLLITSSYNFSDEVYGDVVGLNFQLNMALYSDDFVFIGKSEMRENLPEFLEDSYFQSGALLHASVNGSHPAGNYQVAIIAPNFTILPFLVAHSNSLALVPRRVAHSTIDVFDLEIFELEGENKPIDISAYWSEVHQSDLGHQWLRALVSRVSDSPSALLLE